MIIEKLNDDEKIEIKLFGKKKKVKVFSTGDNKFDEKGNYKHGGFELNRKEIECLNWLIHNVDLNKYNNEIVEYCNNEYEMWSDKKIGINDVESEIDITSIVINVTKNWKADDGSVYPEISFFGKCKCDAEHGICIGFRDKKYIGIANQDWTL